MCSSGGVDPGQPMTNKVQGLAERFSAVKNGGLRLLRHGAGVDEVRPEYLFYSWRPALLNHWIAGTGLN